MKGKKGKRDLQGSWTSRKSVLSLIFDRSHHGLGYKTDTPVSASLFFLHFSFGVDVGGIALQQNNLIHEVKSLGTEKSSKKGIANTKLFA